MKNKKKSHLRTVPKSNGKRVETDPKAIHRTRIYIIVRLPGLVQALRTPRFVLLDL